MLLTTFEIEKVKYGEFPNATVSGVFMSQPSHPAAPTTGAVPPEPDMVESIAHVAPVILPIVGGVLMFLLAFIAVFLA